MSALLVVDVQHDFLTGSFVVPRGEEILPAVYELLDRDDWDLVVASQDFHPAGHVSFASTHGAEPFKPIQILHPIAHGLLESTTSPAELRVRDAEGAGETIEQMLWPDHCVQGTHGCELEDGVRMRMERFGFGKKAHIVQKGDHPLIDGYSAFAMNHYVQFSALPRLLFARGITKVTICGLATDYCMRATAIDARKFQFEVDVVRAGVRAVDPEAEERVLAELERWGCRLV